MSLVAALRRAVGPDHVLTDPDVVAGFVTDWSRRWTGATPAVVRPGSTSETAAVVAACRSAGVAVVPQGGNTGLVGGSIPLHGEVVLSLRRLDQVGPVEDGEIEAGAGATLGTVRREARSAGLEFGVDLAARESATVGGMVATDAGGLHTVRWGSMREQVRAATVVTGTGEVKELDGAAARELAGTEGTAAVITAVRLRLVPPPAAPVTALIGCDTYPEAARLARRIHPLDPLACEVFGRAEIAAVRDHLGLVPPLVAPVYVLAEVEEDRAFDLAAVTAGTEAAVGVDPSDRARLWRYREAITESIAGAGVAVKLDVRLAPESLDALVALASGVAAEPGCRAFVFGHLLAGDFHVNLLGADDDAVTPLLEGVVALGGDPIGEHGAGPTKRGWRDPAARARLAALAARYDPDGILHPFILSD